MQLPIEDRGAVEDGKSCSDRAKEAGDAFKLTCGEVLVALVVTETDVDKSWDDIWGD